jgi:hypothetical protein
MGLQFGGYSATMARSVEAEAIFRAIIERMKLAAVVWQVPAHEACGMKLVAANRAASELSRIDYQSWLGCGRASRALRGGADAGAERGVRSGPAAAR